MADITLTPAADGGLATAMYSDDIRTCVRYETGSKTDYYREVCYNAWDEACEFLLEDDSTDEITDDMIESVVSLTRAEARKKQAGRVYLTAAQAGTWLRDQDYYSPWLDLIAIERAVQFDWDVIDNLTRFEFWTFCERLNDEGYHPSSQTTLGDVQLSPREIRWLDSTPEQRQRVMDARIRARRRTVRAEKVAA